ncbi:hypothetical protein B0H13DRAFT_1915185 [Mycena leptocephala]|nr:hypothetical protein B0H13DRAFT_1915185 [Mycena leptocephala]
MSQPENSAVPMDTDTGAKKRKHNEMDTGSQAAAGDKTSSYPWSDDLVGLTRDQLPPPEVVERFKLLYNDAHKGFRKAFRSFHLTTEARDRLQRGAEGDNIPEDILKTLKGPIYQFSDGIRLEAEAAVHDTQQEFDKLLSETRKKATALQLAKLNAAVQYLRDQTDVNSLVESLRISLIELAAELHADVGILDNTGRWSPYIARVANTLARNLNNTKFAVALEIRREREAKAAKVAKAAKAVAVATAQADVEMADGTKTVHDIVKESISGQVGDIEREMKRLKTLLEAKAPKDTKKKQSKPSTSKDPNAAASSSKAKAKATSVQGTEDPEKKAKKKGKKAVGEKGKGHAEGKAKAKGKARAKASDNESD